ncbi:hypothetical protein AB0D84_29770 [Streptomyces sp. NPDC048193]|uniref:hypothetical protein n=1 Tax=unclassified Streptomyces TaxID=2593676 RepID=UPI0034318508
MSVENPLSLAKHLEPTADFNRKSRTVAILATLFSVAALAATLYAWEPWVDRSPFTARDYNAVGSALFTVAEGGTCVPNDAGKKVELLGEDKRVLAVTTFPAQGEILAEEYGESAGTCFFYVEFPEVPGGEDGYYIRGGTEFFLPDGTPASLIPQSQDDLSKSPESAQKDFRNARPVSD